MTDRKQDIVEWLRMATYSQMSRVMCEEAAAEIERLRSTLARAHNAIGSGKYDRGTVRGWIAEALGPTHPLAPPRRGR